MPIPKKIRKSNQQPQDLRQQLLSEELPSEDFDDMYPSPPATTRRTGTPVLG